MNMYDGIPEGYRFSQPSEMRRNEGTIKQNKQQQTLNEIYKTVPSNIIRGNPISYGEDGLPVIENDPLEQQQYEMSVENQIQRQMQQGQDHYPQQTQQQFNPNAFFNEPSKRNQQAQPQQRPQQPRQQPVQQHIPEPVVEIVGDQLQYHPVVKKMLNVFGLKKNNRYDLDIFNEKTKDKITYTMSLVSEELQSWAMLEGRTRMQLEPDVGAVYFELLFGCCSVVAIDHIPVYTAFGISVLPEEQLQLAEDPLEIPIRIRKKAASILANHFWKDLIPFADKILEAYQEKVLGRKVQSSLDKENDSKVRYVCPLDECEHYEFLPPEVDGEEKSYYCKFHGLDLIKTINMEKEFDIPLA